MSLETIKNIDLDEQSAWWIPLSLGYALGRKAHHASYNLGILKRNKLPKPVICIGNLTVGGTGKTPMIISLARELMASGKKVAILSRGYGAEPKADDARIVSDGTRLMCDAVSSGDEPFLIARSCKGASVIICRSRHRAGEMALERFAPDVLLLDDGFQHEALARELDLVLWDLRDDPARMRQLPAGRLREGLSGLKRAGAVILTHGEYVAEDRRESQADKILRGIKRAAPNVPIFTARTLVSGWRPLRTLKWDTPIEDRPYADVSELRGKRVVLVSGLARADGFERTISGAGAEVISHLPFPDHAKHDASTIERVRAAVQSNRADFALTTEKDAVKFEALELDLSGLFAVGIRMEISEKERWKEFLGRIRIEMRG